MDTNEAKLLYIPMRFYLVCIYYIYSFLKSLTFLFLFQPDTPFRQVLISPHKEDDKTPQEPTLKSALQKACPDINPSGYVIISHGINVPLESPVYWLSKNFCYPDNFVHLVLRHKSDENYQLLLKLLFCKVYFCNMGVYFFDNFFCILIKVVNKKSFLQNFCLQIYVIE